MNMGVSKEDLARIQERAAQIGKAGGGAPRTLAQMQQQGQQQALDPENLPVAVSSAAERRCPFLKVFSEVVEDDVDMICDVRIQTFDTTPPFGPLNPVACELCLKAKTFSLEQDKVDAAVTAVEEAAERQEAEENEAPSGRGDGNSED